MWSDNTGSQHCAAKGTAKAWDHTCIVHAIWLQAARLHMELWVDRVPTEENIADLPSREEYSAWS